MAAGLVATGQLIAGRYRLALEIGRGGMAVVYRAHDEQLGRDVAVKLLDPTATAGGYADDLIAEARAAAALPDPHVATVFDAGEHDGHPFIVMELVEGGDLQAHLRREGRLQPAEAARIGLGIARGLAALHARGLVHCDVKPLNVLLTPDGEPKLVDFGIARPIDQSTTAAGAEEIVGSAPYLSPEQVRGERLDARSDVYALGVVLFELLTGDRPFVGASVAEVAAQRLHRAPRPLAEVAPGVPTALAAVVERALALDPAARFPDGAAMASAFEAAIAALSPARPASVHDEPTRALPIRAATPPRRPERVYKSSVFHYRGTGLALAAVAGLMLLALVGVFRLAAGPSEVAAEMVVVPAVAGSSFDAAAQRLAESGLTASREDQVTEDTPRGIVVTQEPHEGERARNGAAVRLVVSQGVAVPSLVGKQWDDVKPWLDQHGWRIGGLRFIVANRQDFGKVVGQEPSPEAGTVADKASTPLTVVVAGPPEATRTGFQTAPAPAPAPAPPQGSGNERAKPEGKPQGKPEGRPDQKPNR